MKSLNVRDDIPSIPTDIFKDHDVSVFIRPQCKMLLKTFDTQN